MNIEEVKWNVGDPCRVVFPDDGLDYEATIESLGETDGVAFASVVFLFYGNQQSVCLTELLPSLGPEVRAHLETAVVNQEPVVEAVTEAVTPTVVWNVGDSCRAVYADDGQVYDCVISSLTTDEAGNQVAEVVYVGYGNKETVRSKDLLPPLDSADKEVVAELPVDTEAAVADPTPQANIEETVQALDPDVPQPAIVENATPEQEIDAPAASGDMTYAPLTTSTPIDQPSSPKWIKGDKCRAVNPEDNVEYDGIIEHIVNYGDGMIATIQAVGSEKAFTAWVDSLIPPCGASPASFSQSSPDQATISQEPSAIEMTWAVGGSCRTVNVEDGLEYEATIEDISVNDNGDRYATVELLGHGNRLTVWLVDLVESRGQAARHQQEAAVRAAEKAVLVKEDGEARATEAKHMKEDDEANAKALHSKKDAEARAAEVKALQEARNNVEVKALKVKSETTRKSNDCTRTVLQNPASAQSFSSSQAFESQITEARNELHMPEDVGRSRVVPVMIPSNVDSELSRRVKYMDSIHAAGNGSYIAKTESYFVDHFASGNYCSFPTKPGSNTYIEGLIVETWYKGGGKTLCRIKIFGSEEEKFIRISELRLSRGSKARAEQLAQIGTGTGAPASSGNVALLELKFAHCEAELKECRVEFAKSVSQNTSLLKKIEDNLLLIECLQTDNLELGAQITRDEHKIRTLQENFNVARENLLVYKSKATVADQVTKDFRNLIVKLEDLKRDNDALKRELARKKFDQESLENQVIALKARIIFLSSALNNINNNGQFF